MEYRFRGKRLSDNQWEYGGVNDKNTSIVSCHQFILIDPDTLGMHTGEYDIHHCEIYHGDILEVVDAPERCLIVVQLTKYGWTFELHEDSVVDQFPDEFSMGRCKVVGNIWDGVKND